MEHASVFVFNYGNLFLVFPLWEPNQTQIQLLYQLGYKSTGFVKCMRKVFFFCPTQKRPGKSKLVYSFQFWELYDTNLKICFRNNSWIFVKNIWMYCWEISMVCKYWTIKYQRIKYQEHRTINNKHWIIK